MADTVPSSSEQTGQESAGGFLKPNALPSPSASSSYSSTLAHHALPHPRFHPLPAGSAKESTFIRHVDRGLLEVSRRYAKKFSDDISTDPGEVKGYTSFSEVSRDLQRLVDVVWVSGTPSLQTPYLLSIALMLTNYVTAFPSAPRAMFRLLHKLDDAFASLLQGRDIETGETLPGFETRSSLSTTEKVRIKSLVERTRVVIVELATAGGEEEEEPEEDKSEAGEDATEDEDMDYDAIETADRWEMEIARVYDRTMVELGATLGVDGSG